MAHRLALWRGEAGHVSAHRLGDVVLDERRCAFFGIATYLADHDDRLSVGVGLEGRQGIDVRRSDHWVATDPDAGRKSEVAQLVHHLVRQGAALADQPDRSTPGDVSRNDAGVGLPRADDSRAVRPDDLSGTSVLRVLKELCAVTHWNTFGDHHAQRDPGIDRLDYGGFRKSRRHEDDGHTCTRGVHGVRYRAEHRDISLS